MSIVVIGDILLDQDLDGPSTRCVPDSRAPVIDVDRTRLRAGGAGLVARLLAEDGRDVTLVTALSDDGGGVALRRELAGLSVESGPSCAPTPVKTRVLRDGRVVVRLDQGCAAPPAPRVTSSMLRAIRQADAVVATDYGRGLLGQDPVRAALADAAQRVPVVWDPHPRGVRPVPGTWAVTPNLAEAGAMAGTGTGADGAGVAAAARRLVARWEVRAAAVTLGAEGVWLQAGERPTDGWRLETDDVGTPDACGAGDRFTSALAAALLDGADLTGAARRAIDSTSRFLRAGGVRALAASDGHLDHPGTAGAPPSSPDPVDVVRAVREAGGTVVATGGCFDLMHAGHLRTLRAARQMGDALIVCLNSDASVRRLKGPTRPLMGQEDRVELLEGLDCVDAVAVFDEDTPLRILDRLRPDIWVKGGDYLAEVLPEHQLVAAWGGVVRTVPYHPGRSTTALVDALEHATGVSVRD